MTDEGDVVALDGEDGGAVMTPTDPNELAGRDDRVVLGCGAARTPTPVVDLELPARDVFVKDCASATIVDETRARAATTKGIS